VKLLIIIAARTVRRLSVLELYVNTNNENSYNRRTTEDQKWVKKPPPTSLSGTRNCIYRGAKINFARIGNGYTPEFMQADVQVDSATHMHLKVCSLIKVAIILLSSSCS